MTNPTHQAQAEAAIKVLDALLSPAKPKSLWGTEPPDRIWGWRDSQLSIARHYGGCTFRGVTYVIDEVTEGNPLVRMDVISRENKAKALAAKLAQAEASKQQKEIF